MSLSIYGLECTCCLQKNMWEDKKDLSVVLYTGAIMKQNDVILLCFTNLSPLL